ncbi:MAG: hypothetical protein H6834_15420 [Planctomycetes bacterium]|nr:hypothetical protein [Planctomycetota bacterium]
MNLAQDANRRLTSLLGCVSFLFTFVGDARCQEIVTPGLQVGELHGSELLLGELSCTRCHATTAERAGRLFERQPPLLGEVGSRVTAGWLRAYLLDPHGTKPGTTMPDVLHAAPEAPKKEMVEDLVHFLMSLRRSEPDRDVAANAYHMELGRRLFHTIGCVACHEAQEPPPKLAGADDPLNEWLDEPGSDRDERADLPSIPFPDLARKTTVTALERYLLDPRHVRPSGRMPAMGLQASEARALAMYLLREQVEGDGAPEERLVEGLRYSYAESGELRKVADIEKAPVVKTGVTDRLTMDERQRDQHYGLTFEGVLLVRESGRYTFWTSSDDGSVLWIGERKVVDNDGDHATQTREGAIELGVGRHPFRLAFYNHGGGQELKVEWQGPSFERRVLRGDVLRHMAQPMVPVDGEAFTVEEGRAQRGRMFFGMIGCAACHDLGHGQEAVPSRTRAPALDALAGGRGCLAEVPPRNVPRYALSATQRAALDAVLEAGIPEAKLEPDERIHRTMAAMNCYACHVRDGRGGPTDARFAYFVPAMPGDYGDEARVPPPLDGVGAKLKPRWMDQVLFESGKTRPYIATRMPQFGRNALATLPAAFERADLRSEPAPETASADLVRHGRVLVGEGGLSCISCHTYGRYDSLGMPAADLAQMTKRVRQEWFRAFLLDPQRVKPGTRMPQFWPGGVSARDEILDGDTQAQIDAIWSYLAEGVSAKLPRGLVRVGEELIPDEEPIVYRHFIRDAGTRAIAVGYPEDVHIAWDANQMRLALVWRGSFLDASKHRTGRGQGFEGPLGDDEVKHPEGPPFARLDALDRAWPKATGKAAGYDMGGYRLDGERRPTFFYTFDGVTVQDFVLPVAAEGDREEEAVRTLTLSAEQAPRGLYFRAARGAIETIAPGVWRIDGKWTLRATAPDVDRWVVRTSEGSQELLVPVAFENGRAQIAEVLGW